MSRRFEDLTGKRFGRLAVVERVWSEQKKRHFWRCTCDCGNERLLLTRDLTTGKVLSCGCLHSEMVSAKNQRHGCSGTPLYVVWQDVKKRCYLKTSPSYPRYGGRGIAMCDDWRDSFESFAAWANSSGYAQGLSIDRINNDGNYEPSNCRWVTALQQNRNKSTNVLITYGGETKILQEWAEFLGVDHVSLRNRIDKYGVEGAFNYKPRRPMVVECRGQVKTVGEWAREVGMGLMTLHSRLKRYPPEVAIFTPVGTSLRTPKEGCHGRA